MSTAHEHRIHSHQPLLRLVGLVLSLFVLLLITGCATVFSDLQRATLLKHGEQELTAHGGAVMLPKHNGNPGQDLNQTQEVVGLAYAVGMGERAEFRTRLRLAVGETGGTPIIALGPKFSLIPGYLAVDLPIGAAIGLAPGLSIAPALIAQTPEGPLVGVIGVKWNQVLMHSEHSFAAMNVGVRGTFGQMTLQPEVGVAMGMDGEVIGVQLSLGLIFRVSAGP